MEIVSTIISTLATSITWLLVWQMQRIVNRKDHSDTALKLLLRVNMEDKHDYHMERGFISSDDLADFQDMYETYHALGGNGRGTVWKNDLERLERRE